MKTIKLKKSVCIVLILAVFFISCIVFYTFGLHSVSKDSSNVTFQVREGISKISIVNDLKSSGLIRSKTAALVYLTLHKNMTLQAGKYSFSRNMDTPSIFKKISHGDVAIDTITITFIEGKNINDYIALISSKFNLPEKEVKAVFQDKKFMKSLVEKYDFLTEMVLNDNMYYALEGYLYPDTYEFLETVSVEDIIIRMLENTKVKLSRLDNHTDYSIHELLSMASIVELEAVNESDRRGVAQVIYKRLKMGKGLGMDVTTYYAVQKKLGEELTLSDLRSASLYNTSEMNTNMAGKLPLGPICNPSLESIQAVLNPSDTDYLFFYADVTTGKVYFSKTIEEHIQIQKEVG